MNHKTMVEIKALENKYDLSYFMKEVIEEAEGTSSAKLVPIETMTKLLL